MALSFDRNLDVREAKRPVPAVKARQAQVGQLIMALTLSMTLFFAVASSAQPLLTKPTLVTTEWLAQHLNNPNLRIIDARPSSAAYLRGGHIPNSVYLNTETLRISYGGVPTRLLPPERLAEIFGAIGIGNQHTVVVYSSGNDSFAHATYVAFVLEYLGHQSIGILDGGIEKWQAEGRPLSRGQFPNFPPTTFIPKVNEKIRADWRTVQEILNSKEGQVIDARSPQEYEEVHIPNSHNIDTRATLKSDKKNEKVLVWKSPNELSEFLKIDPKKPIVLLCCTGRTSSQLWFTLRHILGIQHALLYNGSMVDWVSRRLPVKMKQMQ